jgi:WD40 repeat protein
MPPIAHWKAHVKHVIDLRFTADSQTLVSAGMDNAIRLWSVPDWTAVRALEGHTHSVNAVAFSPDERTLVSGSSDTTVRLWSFPDGALRHELRDRKTVVSCLCVSSDGLLVVAGRYGGWATGWTLDGEPRLRLHASRKNLSAVAISPDSRLLATAGLGDEIRLWSLPDGEAQGMFIGHQTAVLALHFALVDGALLSFGYEGAIRLWDLATGSTIRYAQVAGDEPRRLVLSPGGEWAAVCAASRVELWSMQTWTFASVFEVRVRSVGSAAFSPDGRWLAAGSADGAIQVWSLEEAI